MGNRESNGRWKREILLHTATLNAESTSLCVSIALVLEAQDV